MEVAFEGNPSRESAARISRLAGRGGSRFVAYPRITYVIRVKLTTHVDLTVVGMSRGLLTGCLDPNDVAASQEIGEFLRSRGVQGIVFPSAIPGFTGRNLVAFRDATPPADILLVNREQILTELRNLAERLTQGREDVT